jgi:hypothetical protein
LIFFFTPAKFLKDILYTQKKPLMKHLPVLPTLAFALMPALSPAAVLDITGSLNNLKINSVLYEESSGFYNQTSGSSSSTHDGFS